MTSVAFVVFEGFQSMALAAMPVFEYANFSAGEALYDVSVLSEDGRTLRASGGLSVGTEAFGEIEAELDFFLGQAGVQRADVCVQREKFSTIKAVQSNALEHVRTSTAQADDFHSRGRNGFLGIA